MAPPRRCNCGKTACFTCHRRAVNERYRLSHAPRVQSCRGSSREVSDAEMDRHALILMGRPACNV